MLIVSDVGELNAMSNHAGLAAQTEGNIDMVQAPMPSSEHSYATHVATALQFLGLWLVLMVLPLQASGQCNVNGTVKTSSGTPVAGATLLFAGDPNMSARSAIDGTYAVNVACGTTSLEVTPPLDSRLLAQTRTENIVGPSTTLDIVLYAPASVRCAARLVDSLGTPIEGATAFIGPRDRLVPAKTDDNGVFSVTVDDGAASAELRNVDCSSANGCLHFGTEAVSEIVLWDPIPLECDPRAMRDVVWEVKKYRGKVVTTSGAPVEGAIVSWDGENHRLVAYTRGQQTFGAEADWRTRLNGIVTDATGDFEFLAGTVGANNDAGITTGSIGVVPPAASGLVARKIREVSDPGTIVLRTQARCTGDAECDDGNPCTFDACTDVCTLNYCPPDGCTHEVSDDPACNASCDSDKRCDDADPSTIDRCTEGSCTHTQETTCSDDCDAGASAGDDSAMHESGTGCRVGAGQSSTGTLALGIGLFVVFAARSRRKRMGAVVRPMENARTTAKGSYR